jgi:hypothetical protein
VVAVVVEAVVRRQGVGTFPASGDRSAKPSISEKRIFLLPPEYKAAVQPRTVEDQHRVRATEIAHLRAEIKRLESVNKFKDGVLLHAAGLLEDVLRYNNPMGIERLKRLVSQLKGAAAREQGGLPE